MKKTIIALLALAGVASAAEREQVLWSLDFTGTSLTSSYAEGVSLSNLPASGINNGLTLNKAPITLTQTGSTLTYSDKFVFSVTLEVNSHNDKWPELAGFGNSTHNWKGAYYVEDNNFVLDRNNFGELWRQEPKLDENGEEVKNEKGETVMVDVEKLAEDVDESQRATGDVSVAVGTPVTLSFKSNGEGTITMYVGDTVAGYTTIDDYYLTQTIDKFALGGRIGGKPANNADVTVYSASLTKIVPEPATATLSLLALAGLAMRRRRK